MTLVSGPLLPLLALVFPLALGLIASIPALRPHAIKLLPLAPLPGLATALFSPRGTATEIPDLLLGVRLGLDDASALLLGMASFLWLMAGIYALAYMRDTQKRAIFVGFWCLTLSGNLGVFLARDVATFYVSFAAVSLAAYILVVHDGTERALRAGRIYIVLAVIGEAFLLLAFLIAAGAAQSLLIADIRIALADAPLRDVAIAAMVIGFGIKAGLMPLHIWLPLAHPAAPTPASAVLSGAIVKAGIFGLMQFLPHGEAFAVWGYALVAMGLASAYIAVLLGLTQGNAKAVLAYSTISQMGLVIAVIGAGMAAENPLPALLAASLYAAHHGFAKGALFLSVGVVAATGRGARPLVVAVIILVALSVAGFPLTGGALAKGAIKGPLEIGIAATLLTLSATGTALLLTHYMLLVTRQIPDNPHARAEPLLVIPFLACALAALILPWLIFPEFSGLARSYVLTWATLWGAIWPLALAGLIGVVALRLRLRPPNVPEGDLAVPLEHAAIAMVAGSRRGVQQLREAAEMDYAPFLRGLAVVDRLEAGLSRWAIAGLLLVSLVLAISLGLGW
jgi:formate hydrogenlyase subunit 3/multisubunit Na+/H+ antiporter MnhD subunit